MSSKHAALSLPLAVKPPPPVSRWVRALCRPWTLYEQRRARPRLSRLVVEQVKGSNFIVSPGVLNPVIFRAGRYLAEYIASSEELAPRSADATLLDLGTGCGILGVMAALRGYRVKAVDIEPGAVACARANVAINGVEDRMSVLEGDLFTPVRGEQFDAVVFNLPFFRGTPATPLERAWMSPDVIERCAAGLPQAIKANGLALFVLSSHGDARGMLSALAASLLIERLTWRHFGVETMAIYRAYHHNHLPVA